MLMTAAFVAVTPAGFVDGACFTMVSEETARWIEEMRAAGMCVVETDRSNAKQLLFTTLPETREGLSADSYGRMIVARRACGEVEAAGWDCAETRADAKEWLGRGLALELVDAAQVERLGGINPAHVFATRTPAGVVLTTSQATEVLAGY